MKALLYSFKNKHITWRPMAEFNPRIDDYIEKSADFAKPILRHLRALVHEMVPQVEEAWKWSFPNFVYRGGILCSMASFKNHCAFGFWKGAILKTGEGIFSERGQGMGHLGKIQSMADLPPDELIKAALQEAMSLNEHKIKVAKVAKPVSPQAQVVPEDFRDLLNENPAAALTFDQFSPSNRKEYLEWIAEAKTEATRSKRMATSVEWLSEGKIRHWKYNRQA